MRNNKKLVVIALLLLVVVGMGVGYSILSKQLKIEGTATLDSEYNVQITGIERTTYYDTEINTFKGFNPTPVDIDEPSFTSTTARFNVKLEQGATAMYIVTLKNTGNIDAIVESVIVNKTGAEAVVVETPTDIEGAIIHAGMELKYLVKVTYDDRLEVNENELSSNITVEFNTRQLLETDNDPGYGLYVQKPYIVFVGGHEEEIQLTTVFKPGCPYTPEIKLYVANQDGEYTLIETKTWNDLDQVQFTYDISEITYSKFKIVLEYPTINGIKNVVESNEIILDI